MNNSELYDQVYDISTTLNSALETLKEGYCRLEVLNEEQRIATRLIDCGITALEVVAQQADRLEKEMPVTA